MAVCGMTADAAETPEKSGKSVTYGGITYDIYKDHAEVTKVDLDVYTGYNPEYAENKVFAFPKEIQYQETGEIKPVTALRYNDCYRNFSAKKIIIPSSVTTCKIGFGNYTPNEVLEEVTFENGSQLKRLYGSIFWNCVALNRVGIDNTDQLPDDIVWIDEHAFEGCSSLTSIKLPKKLTTISTEAFKDCVNLKEVTFSPSIQICHEKAFYNCTNLSRIIFETNSDGKNDLKRLGVSAFENCKNLKEINLPMSSTSYSIGLECFKNTGLTSINIPDCVSEIERRAFEGVKFENNLKTPKGEKYAIGIFGPQAEIAQPSNYTESIFGDTYNDKTKDDRPTIAGLAYSTANDFAIKEDFYFISVGDWNPFKVILPGDVNGDSEINVYDITPIIRYINHLSSDIDITIADVNGDGEVNVFDITKIIRYINGLDEKIG